VAIVAEEISTSAVMIMIALKLKGKWLHNSVLAGAADRSSDLNS